MARSSSRRGQREERAERDQHGMHSLEFRLPDLGEGLTEAEIVHWLVDVGDLVAVDQPVVEVETAKAMVEVPCPYGGVVTARFGEEGTELPVGAPLLTVAVGQTTAADGGAPSPTEGRTGQGRPGGPRAGAGSGGRAARAGHADHAGSAGRTGRDEHAAEPEPEPGVAARGSAADRRGAERHAARTAAADEGSGHVLVGYGTAGVQARRRRARPASGGRSPDTRGPHGPHGGGGSRDALQGGSKGSPADAGGAARAVGPVPVISPLVRRLARDHGLDLREIPGSGPDGLIMRADVEHAVRAAPSTQAAPATPLPDAAPQSAAAGVRAGAGSGSRSEAGAVGGSGLRVPLRGMRGAIADKLARSRREIPDATCWVDADATELLGARAAMNAAGGPKISVLALLARICTAALARYPELNATVDTEAREIVRLDRVHLGFAAQTDRGLVVPVVRDAQSRDAQSLSTEFARLTEAARAGTLTPGDLTGGTFTLNNYGVFGVDGSTPIVNHPEAAMLGVGRITAKPWVHQGELAVRQVVQLSFTFDHRVCDGGTAGGFLRYVADCVEQPVVLLRDL